MNDAERDYYISELGTARRRAETLLGRFFSSEHDWYGVLEKFDLAKGQDDLLEGWMKEELEQVLKLVTRAANRKLIATMRSGNMHLERHERLRARLTAEGVTPEEFGTSLREIAKFRRKAVEKEVREKLSSINGEGAMTWQRWDLYPRIDLIEFLAKEKRKLSEFFDAKAFWKEFEAECNFTLLPEHLAIRAKGKGKDGKARLICEILSLHRAKYITLDPRFDLDALLAQAKRLNKYAEVSDLPKV